MMKTETKSRILFTTLILAGMSPACYLLPSGSYMLYGILLIIAGLALLVWLWKPWHWFKS